MNSECLRFDIPHEFLVAKSFHAYQHFFTLWLWSWGLAYYLKTLTLLITFQQWLLEFSYFTWIFRVIRSFVDTQTFDLDIWHIWKKNKIYHKYLINIRAFIMHMNISFDRSLYWCQGICPCDLGHIWNWPLSGAFVFHKHILFSFCYCYCS